MKRRRPPNDPEFAAEMAALAAERRRQREEANEEFRIAWAARLQEGLPPPIPSIQHSHSEQCLRVVGAVVQGQQLRIRRCTVTGLDIEEVT